MENCLVYVWQDIHGMTALFYAVDGEFSNVVRALVRAGADVNHCESDNGYTPLIRLGRSPLPLLSLLHSSPQEFISC